MLHTLLATISLSVLLNGCGVNIYEHFDDSDPVEEAVRYLESGKFDRAITILDGELSKRPDDPEVLSLLSAAIAQKHGLDPLSYALALSKSASDGKNNVSKTFTVLPLASDENIAALQQAIDFLLQIDPDHRTDSDKFKLAMLNAAIMSLISKKFSDESGQLTAESLASMSQAEAEMILGSLDNAAEALMDANISGKNSAAAAGQIEHIKATIQAQEGASDWEKLKNYLSQ